MMKWMAVGLIYAPVYLKHDTGGHVERGERVIRVMENLSPLPDGEIGRAHV